MAPLRNKIDICCSISLFSVFTLNNFTLFNVRKLHLAPYLPTHPIFISNKGMNDNIVPTVCSAPFGSAGILPISWSYIKVYINCFG